MDPMPCWATELSVTIHNWSLGRGNVIDLLVDNVFWARPGAIPTPESESKDDSDSDSGVGIGVGIICS